MESNIKIKTVTGDNYPFSQQGELVLDEVTNKVYMSIGVSAVKKKVRLDRDIINLTLTGKLHPDKVENDGTKLYFKIPSTYFYTRNSNFYTSQIECKLYNSSLEEIPFSFSFSSLYSTRYIICDIPEKHKEEDGLFIQYKVPFRGY